MCAMGEPTAPFRLAPKCPWTTTGFWNPGVWEFVEPSTHLEVWTETRGMAGSLARTAWYYGVGITASGGMPSASLIYEAAARMRDSEGERKVVLYLGDADRHGFQIEAQIRADFEQTHGTPIEWHRIAISKEEAKERGDPNAEVIPLAEMRSRLQAAIREVIGDGYDRRNEAVTRYDKRFRAFERAIHDDYQLSTWLQGAEDRIEEIREDWEDDPEAYS